MIETRSSDVVVRPIGAGQGLLGADDAVEALTEYTSRGGYAALPSAAAVVDLARDAALRGRGGAGFPTVTKMEAVANSDNDVRYVVANGEEGEPASVKDRYLLRHRPHLVLDGLRLAARAVGAEKGYVYLSDSVAAEGIRRAIEESPGDLDVELFVTEPAYVAGEESAVVRAINGGPAKPTAKPPRPFEEGVAGAPTLVQNVETLARLALLTMPGEPHAAASTLLTVSQSGQPAVLTEVPADIRLGEAIGADCHGSLTGVLMGGFAGGLHAPTVLSAQANYDGAQAVGAGLGCGAVVLLGPDDCPVAAAADVAAYFDRENAAQCGACIRGTDAMAADLRALTLGTGTEAEIDRLTRLSTNLRRRGACGLLDASCVVVSSLLTNFNDAVTRHVATSCPACAEHPVDPGQTRFRIAY